jgi:hypothetical protein
MAAIFDAKLLEKMTPEQRELDEWLGDWVRVSNDRATALLGFLIMDAVHEPRKTFWDALRTAKESEFAKSGPLIDEMSRKFQS